MNVLVVSPHPDDETLGCGGTMARLKAEKNKIYWLNITDMSERMGYTKEQITKRKKQMEKVAEMYDVSEFKNLELTPTALEQYNDNEMIGRISEFVQKVQPEMVFLPDFNDAHSDHKKTFEWCFPCTKAFRYPFVKSVFTMEILSETDFGQPMNPFLPNVYFDISSYLERKLEIMKVYDTELGEHPFPRNIGNIKALARLRGSAAGVEYAEAFRSIKMIY